MEPPSLVSKARTAFHSAAAKAEKVLTDINTKKSHLTSTDHPDSHAHSDDSPIPLGTSKINRQVKDLKWRPAPIKAKHDWQERFKKITTRNKGVDDNSPDDSAMAFAIFDQNLYLENPGDFSQPKVLESCSLTENPKVVNVDIIPPVAYIKQLAIAIEAGKNYKTIKDLMACSTSSSPVRERASLSFLAMKSLVLREKEEKFASEFSADTKALSLINMLVDAEGHHAETESGSGHETAANSSLPKEIHGAPPESFIIKLAEAVGSLKTLKKMAFFWLRVVAELRRLWSEGLYIPGIPVDEIPDLNSCLLYQQLQVINCCISRKRRQSIAAESLDSVLLMQARINGEESTTPADALPLNPVFYAKISTGELVLRLGADKQCDNLKMLETGEPMYTPVTQEGPLLTEDLIKENEEFVLRTGSVGAGCSQLLSDMQAFKAANPGCILEDFVRWHSPPDWMEPEICNEAKESPAGTDLHSTKGQLSGRMQKEGNLWRELWETSKPVPAIKQSPLYDEDLSVEGILNAFEGISPAELFEQLFVSLLGVGFINAEPRLAANSSISKLFSECKDYIIAACQGKIWVEKIDDICQVYETVELMLSNPDEVLNMSKNADEGSTGGDQKSKFKRLSLIFGGKDRQSKKTPKDQKNSQETPKQQSFASIFSKKPPKHGNASSAEKPVSSVDNDLTNV
ncbi:uncharacterized protein LOC108223595 [Daucus carota subsp. sativus]|nr:PREDICTED: rab3 GTPase-activating protein catalytic subunit [Daucus carota subsp. sativus]